MIGFANSLEFEGIRLHSLIKEFLIRIDPYKDILRSFNVMDFLDMVVPS